MNSGEKILVLVIVCITLLLAVSMETGFATEALRLYWREAP